MRDKGHFTWLLGWGVPTALVCIVICAVQPGTHALFGISLKSWLLFACAPVTSLCLLLASRLQPAKDRT